MRCLRNIISRRERRQATLGGCFKFTQQVGSDALRAISQDLGGLKKDQATRVKQLQAESVRLPRAFPM